MTNQEKNLKKIELFIPESYFENKNKLLGGIIRYGKELVKNTNIKGNLDEFGDETPISTTVLREILGMSSHNLSYHINSFKKNQKELEGVDIIPFIQGGNGPDIYTRKTIRKFISYLNRNGLKYNIEL